MQCAAVLGDAARTRAQRQDGSAYKMYTCYWCAASHATSRRAAHPRHRLAKPALVQSDAIPSQITVRTSPTMSAVSPAIGRFGSFFPRSFPGTASQAEAERTNEPCRKLEFWLWTWTMTRPHATRLRPPPVRPPGHQGILFLRHNSFLLHCTQFIAINAVATDPADPTSIGIQYISGVNRGMAAAMDIYSGAERSRSVSSNLKRLHS